MEYGTSGIGTSPSVFNTPGIRPTDQNPQQPQASTARPQQQEVAASRPQEEQGRVNTAPTAEQRETALSAGQTRGSFVDIRA